MTENLHRNGRSCINGHLWLADGFVCHSLRVDTELKGHDVPIDKGQALLSEPPEFYFEGGKSEQKHFLYQGVNTSLRWTLEELQVVALQPRRRYLVTGWIIRPAPRTCV